MSFNNHSKICSSGHGSIENHKLASLWGNFEQQAYRVYAYVLPHESSHEKHF